MRGSWGFAGRTKQFGLRRERRCEIHGLSKSEREGRIHVLSFFVVTFAALVLLRVCVVQTSEHQRWLRLALRQHETSVTVEGARGNVYDAQGRALAVSIEARGVAIRPKLVTNRYDFVALASPLLGVAPKDLREKLASDKPFVWLAHGVSTDIAARLGAELGVETFPEFRRSYPQNELGRMILGKVSLEGKGQSGIELAFDSSLRAADSVLPIRRDARGRAFLTRLGDLREAVSPSLLRPAFAMEAPGPEVPSMLLRDEGSSVALTIDSIVQRILEEEFAVGLRDAAARRVFGLVMDASTGEILALAQQVRSGERDALEALRNIAIQDAFEPGSTFKPLVAAMALDAGLVRTNEPVNCENGSFHVAGHTIRDVHPVPTVPFSEVLVRSSNIGIAKVGSRLGRDRFREQLRDFGFGKKSGVELPGEGSGLTKESQRWSQIDLITSTFGQGISVTALQLVRAYAALANGGLLLEPTVIKGSDRAVKRVLRSETANEIAKIIQGVTENEEGTGRNAAINGLHVSGKTGTAQKSRVRGRGYDPDKILASFVGFVDAHPIGVERKLVMFVAVDEPGVKPRWGGVVAAPVFRRAMERTLSYLMAGGPERGV